MRALIVSCVFPPEPVVSSQTSAQVAGELIGRGHEATVVTTFPNRPGGELSPGYERRLFQVTDEMDGVNVVRCFSILSPKSGLVTRLLENLSFGLTSGWVVLTSERSDVIYSNTWPIVATGILFVVAKIRRIPLIISVQDIYPEVLIAQQRLREDSLLVRLIRWIDGVIACHSSHIIVISERFAEIYRNQRRVQSNQLSLVPNWIDRNMIDVSVPRHQFRLRRNIAENDFLLVYGGNVGMAAGVETVIESMRYLTDQEGLRLLVAGAGSQLPACQELARHIPGQRVVFHSPWLAEETSELLRSADLLVLPTQGRQSLTSVPSKLLTYMLSARPVIAMATPESDLTDLLKRSQCGWVVEPDLPDLLAAKIKEVMQLDPAERQRRGDRGREYVLQHFTKDVCLPKVIQILEEAGR